MGKYGAGPDPELLRHIADLRRLTLESEDLSVPALHFHERLVTHPEFPSFGSPSQDATLVRILNNSVQRVMPAFKPERWHMMQVGSCSFWHGMAEAFPVGLAVFFYFDDAGMGVMEATSLSSPNAHYLRFTAVPGAAPTVSGLVKRGQA
jgi:hypothetical protein